MERRLSGCNNNLRINNRCGSAIKFSVRRSANTVRITTQLINAVTGFHLWSHSYDRDLGDVLKLETDIADAISGTQEVIN
jgi:TolB-like protein